MEFEKMQGLSFDISRASEAGELENEYDVVILGGGPAGLTAAIYASRAKAKTLLIEKEIIGGEAASTALIENYPGFPEGINGTELADRMRRQAERFGTKVAYATPTVSDLKSWPLRVGLEEKTVAAKAVIIASGTSPKTLNISGEKELKGRGVSYCATCDGPIFTGKEIAIIGAGNSGLQEGLFILKFVKSLTIVEYLPTIQAEKILQDRMTAHENVKWLLNHEIVAVNGDKWVTSISVKDRALAEMKKVPVQGVFIYVGLIPNTDYLGGQVELNDWGYILTDQKMQTSLPGVFAAGDIRETEMRQVATAIGDGAVAAASAQHFIDNL
jgi:thioredoxin reductase (NADPH)